MIGKSMSAAERRRYEEVAREIASDGVVVVQCLVCGTRHLLGRAFAPEHDFCERCHETTNHCIVPIE